MLYSSIMEILFHRRRYKYHFSALLDMGNLTKVSFTCYMYDSRRNTGLFRYLPFEMLPVLFRWRFSLTYEVSKHTTCVNKKPKQWTSYDQRFWWPSSRRNTASQIISWKTVFKKFILVNCQSRSCSRTYLENLNT